MKRLFAPAAVPLLILLASCAGQPRPAPVLAPVAVVDEVAEVRARLRTEREAVRQDAGADPADRLQRMVELGMWPEAEALLAGVSVRGPELRLAEAELRLRQHRYEEAGKLIGALRREDPSHREALLLQARLHIQAWELPKATRVAQALLKRNRRDEDAALLLGRIQLLEKRYDEALRWAERVQTWNPGNADAHLLEADARFWDRDLAAAEPALVRALRLDPLDPDARFSYGYAIWRRVDATQLDAMAAQWNLALDLDPLHYLTHWHFGNGHTHLTYADYAEPTDSVVRERLQRADSLISAGRIAQAIVAARDVEREHPESVLPAMLRASAFYMAWGMERGARLDSAQAIFRSVLERKPNYGPAHNGLAAVIKQRQVAVLADFDSLQTVIEATPTPPNSALEAVFPDIRYYPGDRVEKMVRQQLGPSAAYLPLIQRQQREYRIPPLHKDLAEVMGRSFFRTATTFDNRQWMDIRGVGSGAAAIEYVERGSYQERNVLLHEYVHLFHGIVFTDAESRRVRELYHEAMREGRVLDYYAANNESEFLAQAYPAFLAPVKVHPLNHKSMNTRDDLWRKDPETYAFVDSLIVKQNAFLGGNAGALKSNWAQVYVNLSERVRRDEKDQGVRWQRATALLDTALVWDANYLPALISYAALERDQGRFVEAERWLAHAEEIDPGYAPIYSARAELVGARARARGEFSGPALDHQVDWYRRALALERDLAERARLNEALRELYRDHGRFAEAVQVAEEYVDDAPTLSTYLRDRRDEAAAFAHALRSAAGHAQASLDFFRTLVAQKPQNYSLRTQFADALVAAGEMDEAAATLQEVLRIQWAAGSADASLLSRLAEIQLLQGDTTAARESVRPILNGRVEADASDLRLVRVLVALGQITEAHRRLELHPKAETALTRAELAYTRGWLLEWRMDVEMAELAYREALDANPYHRIARVRLVDLLRASGRDAESQEIVDAAAALPLPLGPDFRRELTGAPFRLAPRG